MLSPAHLLVGLLVEVFWYFSTLAVCQWPQAGFTIPLLLGVLVVHFVLCVWVASQARAYKRSGPAWFYLAILFTPIVAFVFLLVADVPHGAVLREEKERAIRTRHPGKTEAEIGAILSCEHACPSCAAVVNTKTGEGIVQTEDQPWALSCQKCGTALPRSLV